MYVPLLLGEDGGVSLNFKSIDNGSRILLSKAKRKDSIFKNLKSSLNNHRSRTKVNYQCQSRQFVFVAPPVGKNL